MQVLITSVFWTGLGALLFQFQLIPPYLPKLIGRSLYWFGVPLQIFVLAHRSHFSQMVWLAPTTMGIVLLLGLGLAHFSFKLDVSILKGIDVKSPRSHQGSYILAALLGNVSFVGLSIVPTLVQETYWGWIVLYSVTHTLLGSYGLGIFLASYFGRQHQKRTWQVVLRDVLIAPSLWSFVLGWMTRDFTFYGFVEFWLQCSVSTVTLGAFLLIGIQLSRLRGLKNLHCVLIPTLLKILILPGLVGLGLSLVGVSGDARLALVLMSGMPTAFANVILAEEFDLDSQLAAGSIFLSTISFPVTISLWLTLFG